MIRDYLQMRLDERISKMHSKFLPVVIPIRLGPRDMEIHVISEAMMECSSNARILTFVSSLFALSAGVFCFNVWVSCWRPKKQTCA